MTDYELLVWTPDMVRDFWDYEAQFPEKFFTYRRGSEIIRQIADHLPEDGTILDYGCGPGNLIAPLLEAGYRVAGLDSSPSARQQVAERFGNEDGFLGAYEQKEIDLSGLRFDVIIVAEVIEHLYDDQLDSLLETLRTLSNPGTRIIFTTPNEEVLEDSYILCPVSRKLFHRWQHVRSWSGDSIRDYLGPRGFEVITTFTTDFDVTFDTRRSKHPLRDKWSALRQTLKYRTRPDKKRPHLVIIARAGKTAA
ncbi:MAG TPA: class I SAM-dependent methyltransferase [Gammaproteobacteria bacterium]|nr:class I SAM-dependent methyltransferase [Gammaproteobacteria bacterium]